MRPRGVVAIERLTGWATVVGLIIFMGSLAVAIMLSPQPVSASIEEAERFADRFCPGKTMGSDGKWKPHSYGLADLVWITAPDGGRVINANRGDARVKVKVNIAGRYCPDYSAKLAGSTYQSTRHDSDPLGAARLGGKMNYNNNGAGRSFYVSELKDFYVKDISNKVGRHELRVKMTLATYTEEPDLMSLPSPNTESTIVFNFTEKWRVEGSTSINRTTAYPGDEVRWTSALTNKGPSNTSRQIENRLVNSNGWSGTHTNHNVSTGKRAGEIRKVNSPMRVTQEHVGKTYCQSIQWRPGSES